MRIYFKGKRLRRIKTEHFNHRFHQRIGKFSIEKTNDIVLDILHHIKNQPAPSGERYTVRILDKFCTVTYNRNKNSLITVWSNEDE